jgi:hypothetical protein
VPDLVTNEVVAVQLASLGVPMANRTRTVDGTPVPPLLTNVAFTVPAVETVKEEETAPPTGSVPEKVSVVVGAAGTVVVVVVDGEVELPPHAALSTARTTRSRKLLLS